MRVHESILFSGPEVKDSQDISGVPAKRTSSGGEDLATGFSEMTPETGDLENCGAW